MLTIRPLDLASGTLCVKRADFGRLRDDRVVEAVTLRAPNGLCATLMSFGASLQALQMPGRDGTMADVVLGHSDVAPYRDRRDYFGSTVGRIANRVARGQLVIDGELYQMTLNDGAHALHGGEDGLDQRLWAIQAVEEGEDAASVCFALTSPHRDQGLPGEMALSVTYRLDVQGWLTIELVASCDRTTAINLTNHAYWNLGGEGSEAGAMDHLLHISAERFLPVGPGLIPTGERRSIENTPFDFSEARKIGERVRHGEDPQLRAGRGYDHCWIWDESDTASLHYMASLADERSGRAFELWSNQPGLQFYSGNFLDGTVIGKSGRAYRQGDAVVLEPQRAPDCVNQPVLGTASLQPGAIYRHVMQYRFGLLV